MLKPPVVKSLVHPTGVGVCANVAPPSFQHHGANGQLLPGKWLYWCFAVQARWVLDSSLDPCYLGEFSGLIMKLVFIFPLICRIIILICMYLLGLPLTSPFPCCLWTGLSSPAGIRVHLTVLLFSSVFSFFCQGDVEGETYKSVWAYLWHYLSSDKGHSLVWACMVSYNTLGHLISYSWQVGRVAYVYIYLLSLFFFGCVNICAVFAEPNVLPLSCVLPIWKLKKGGQFCSISSGAFLLHMLVSDCFSC